MGKKASKQLEGGRTQHVIAKDWPKTCLRERGNNMALPQLVVLDVIGSYEDLAAQVHQHERRP
jgi:hypothetical protein